jgi:pyridoxal phosphate enzyme (YggS family)
VHLIHGVDSLKLLKEIDKQAAKNNRVIDCLLQVHIAQEETKFGLSEDEVQALIGDPSFDELRNIRVTGLMGMASFTDDENQLRQEFRSLKQLFDELEPLAKTNFQPSVLSMGMSGDHKIAIEEGSTMVRIGSAIFGVRNKAL